MSEGTSSTRWCRELRLGERTIGSGQPALIVAEIGQNHNGSVALAEELVDAAAWAGADAVKLAKRDLQWELTAAAWQTPYRSRHAFGSTYGKHRQALELSADSHRRLARRAREHGLVYFATCCDVPSVELMRELDVPIFKIASRDLGNVPLVEYVARQCRPVVLSTGMSGWEEIDEAVTVMRRWNKQVVLLHCTSLYPAPIEEAHLRSMTSMAKRYGTLVGFSDHTRGTLLAPVAVALGAAVVEKHLTLDRKLKGTDHCVSLEPSDFARMVQAMREVEAAMGRPDKPVPAGAEAVRAKLGRSLVSSRPIPRGTLLRAEDVVLKSPGQGLRWADRHRILGRRAARDIAADEMLGLEDFVLESEAAASIARG